MLPFQRILVPIDFSEEAEHALQSAITIAKTESKAVIYLLHVLPYVVDPTYLIGWTDDLVGLRWSEAKRELEIWQQKVPAQIECVPLLRQGGIVSRVCTVCEERNVDLVIVTTHGRRGLARAVRPNASEKIVRLAPCPVVVLHLHQKKPAVANASHQILI